MVTVSWTHEYENGDAVDYDIECTVGMPNKGGPDEPPEHGEVDVVSVTAYHYGHMTPGIVVPISYWPSFLDSDEFQDMARDVAQSEYESARADYYDDD